MKLELSDVQSIVGNLQRIYANLVTEKGSS
jgi:hypothetical protein